MNPALASGFGISLHWVIVAVLVLVCAFYSTWRLLPVNRRLRLVEWLLPAAQRANLSWPGRLRVRLRTQALKACGGGCCGADGVTTNGAARTRNAGVSRR